MEVIHKIGRRKTSVARVYMSEGKGNITVNKKSYSDFFSTATLQYKILQPFNLTDTKDKFDLSVNVKGGGVNGCLLYTSPSPRDKRQSRMPSSA